MSAGTALSKAGPSASKDKNAKRTRKRSRNKKRTTQVEDDDSSSSSSSGDSDDEEEPKPKAAPVGAPKLFSKKLESDSDSDSDDDEEGKDDGGEGDAKRKRKRKRTTKKKTAEESAKVAAAPAATTTTPTTPAPRPVTLSPNQIGPDPNSDLRLSDQAKQAIQYAQVYTKDKSQWKFNKAKQNWLLRNALSVPPADYDAVLARKQGEGKDAEDGAKEEDGEEAEEGENFVPDDFVAVVTAYLTSVMGGARQRLIESLREALNAPAVQVAPIQSDAADDAAKVANATNEQSTDAAANGTAAPTTPTSKSVSFGNLALESERKEEAVEAAGLPTGTDPRAVELRRTRATQMLQQMGEAL
ncbi:hypothetical protein EX895_003785 [Sporisorium graminicola]|uniref:WKF domain-containing protein n=1 Tax=Sporisorium graminicola TaxID=280036 RepID=A0A4U7KUT8_9BASI|nr:hypothetical protein EX895_003785 [Sporisorium graminicola]TKY87108.1 hypothetical protein EX895_003785 [Sporisorium graminicola]